MGVGEGGRKEENKSSEWNSRRNEIVQTTEGNSLSHLEKKKKNHVGNFEFLKQIMEMVIEQTVCLEKKTNNT